MTARQAAPTSTTAVARPKTMAHSALPSLAASSVTAKQPKQAAATRASPMPTAAPFPSPSASPPRSAAQETTHHADHGHGHAHGFDGGQGIARGDAEAQRDHRIGRGHRRHDPDPPDRETAVERGKRGHVEHARQRAQRQVAGLGRRLAHEHDHRHQQHQAGELRGQQHGEQPRTAALDGREEVRRAPGDAGGEGEDQAGHHDLHRRCGAKALGRVRRRPTFVERLQAPREAAR